MEENTKHNPGCYHSALEYLSKLTGTPQTKEIIVKDMSGLRNKSGRKLEYPSRNITVIDREGNRHPYMTTNSERFDVKGIIADHFIVTVNKRLEEFGVEIKREGTYNDSLGGGWSQNVPMYSINGKYFADMDCAH